MTVMLNFAIDTLFLLILFCLFLLSIVTRRESGWETKQKPIQDVLCPAKELERYSRPDLRVHNLFPKWPEFRMNDRMNCS